MRPQRRKIYVCCENRTVFEVYIFVFILFRSYNQCNCWTVAINAMKNCLFFWRFRSYRLLVSQGLFWQFCYKNNGCMFGENLNSVRFCNTVITIIKLMQKWFFFTFLNIHMTFQSILMSFAYFHEANLTYPTHVLQILRVLRQLNF